MSRLRHKTFEHSGSIERKNVTNVARRGIGIVDNDNGTDVRDRLEGCVKRQDMPTWSLISL
jgi:hypothetical protein